MKDLDIRGAGNLLGGEQSGFMADIGMDAYQKILEEAVHELKQEQFKEMLQAEEQDTLAFVKEAVLETDFEILLPDEYVSSIAERISIYRELDVMESEEQLQKFEMTLIDRFGPIPRQSADLIETIRLRWLARDIGFEKLVLKSGKLIGQFVSKENSPYYQSAKFTRVLEYIKYNPTRGKMYEKNGGLRMSFPNVESLETANEILGDILRTGNQ